MKKFQKMLLMLLILVVAVSLAACGGGTDTNDAEQTGDAGDAAATAEGYKIVVVTSPSGVDDGSFNQDVYNGVMAFVESRGNIDTVKTVQEPTGDAAASVQAVADVIADYDVIVTPGFQFAGIGVLAQENPEKTFILVDAYPCDADGAEIALDNVYAMQFAEQESGFFAGVAAALETKSGKVAVVNGVAYPSNVNYQWGFESGVQYAIKHYGATAEIVELASYAGTDVTGANVGGNYVGNFNDEATGKVLGDALLQEGCDIIFVAAGNSGNGVFTAAKEKGAMVIGCDTDQYDDGVNGDTNILLTSVLKNMALNVERQLNALVDGTFVGGNNLLQANTDSTGFVQAEGRHQLSEDTLTKLNDVYALVQSGDIVPAANFNGNTPDNFPGL